MALSKEQAKQILESRVVISRPGKFTAKVTNVTYGHNRTNKDGSTTVVDIVNFAAMTAYQSQQAVAKFKEGDYDGAASNSLSTSVLNGQYSPAKGEIVDIEVSEMYSENVDANILVVSSIVPRRAEQASTFKLGIDEEETVTTGSREASLV